MLSTTTAETTTDLYGETHNVTACALFTPYLIFLCFAADSSCRSTIGLPTPTTAVTAKTHDTATLTTLFPTSLVLPASCMITSGCGPLLPAKPHLAWDISFPYLLSCLFYAPPLPLPRGRFATI